jgi:hypothetical protein
MIKKTFRNGQWYQDGEPCEPPPRHEDTGRYEKVQAQWPILSDAAGCHPDQIEDYKKHLSDRGVPTDFTPDGRMVFRDRSHRRRVLKAIGYVDRSSYYGY